MRLFRNKQSCGSLVAVTERSDVLSDTPCSVATLKKHDNGDLQQNDGHLRTLNAEPFPSSVLERTHKRDMKIFGLSLFSRSCGMTPCSPVQIHQQSLLFSVLLPRNQRKQIPLKRR
jgi:hypothetical protein